MEIKTGKKRQIKNYILATGINRRQNTLQSDTPTNTTHNSYIGSTILSGRGSNPGISMPLM